MSCSFRIQILHVFFRIQMMYFYILQIINVIFFGVVIFCILRVLDTYLQYFDNDDIKLYGCGEEEKNIICEKKFSMRQNINVCIKSVSCRDGMQRKHLIPFFFTLICFHSFNSILAFRLYVLSIHYMVNNE